MIDFFQNAFQPSGFDSVIQGRAQIQQEKADAVNGYAEGTVAVAVFFGFKQHHDQTCCS